jgi:condensin complex subunit 3
MAHNKHRGKYVAHPPLQDDAVATILDECQRSFATHRKALHSLTKLHVEHIGFVEEFMAHVNRVLVVFKREPAVERVVQFIVKFVTHTEGKASNGSDFPTFFLRYLLGVYDAKDKAVRFRVCQLIGGVLNTLNEDAEIECVYLQQSLNITD